jgi:hypothetical protein
LVPAAEVPESLRGEWNHAGNPRRTHAPGQLQQRQRSQDHSDLLETTAQQLRQLVLVLLFDFDTQSWASHTPSMGQNMSESNGFLQIFQAVKDLVV